MNVMALFSDLMELVAVLDRDHAQQLISDVIGVIGKHKSDLGLSPTVPAASQTIPAGK